MARHSLTPIFAALSSLGFILVWGVTSYNGGTLAMMRSAWFGIFPDGMPFKTKRSGLFAVDFPLNVVVAFFAAVSKLDYADSGPWLALVDLTGTMLVINMMVLVESRRSRGFWLRSPAIWQYLWNCVAVAVCLPIWALIYVNERGADGSTPRRIANSEAQAFPLSALLGIALLSSSVLPAFVGAGPTAIQDGIVLFLFGAPIFVGFQAVASRIISEKKLFHNPVKYAYVITGVISALVHLGTFWYALASPDVSLSRVYLPHFGNPEIGKPNLLTESVHLFIQHDYIVLVMTVLVLGVHILNTSSGSKAHLVLLSAVFGPGAGLAYAVCCGEPHQKSAAVAQRKTR